MKTQEFTPSDDVIEDITIEDNGHLIDYGYLEPIGEDDLNFTTQLVYRYECNRF